MKTILYSPIHIRDQAHADALKPDLVDWHARMLASFDKPEVLLIERGGRHTFNPIDCNIMFAGIPDTKPYDAKEWSYGVAAGLAGMAHAMQTDFDLCVVFSTDIILGGSLQAIANEFMKRPEIAAGPLWHGSPDAGMMLLKRPAVIDILYSVPFQPLGSNRFYWEHALAMTFDRKWWNPWPDVPTIRHEYGTPEQVKIPDAEILRWPMLAKTSPALAKQYRNQHSIERITP